VKARNRTKKYFHTLHPSTGPYTIFRKPLLAHTYHPLLAERKRKNPDAALTGGTCLSVDNLIYVELIFNTFLINRNNKFDHSILYY
jgi:hypothetical protein